MATRELHSWVRPGVEPPRDGEFGLQAELSSDEGIAGYGVGWRLTTLAVALWGTITRNPVLSACVAISVGVLISSLLMISPSPS
jgi:hypothetical protein